MIALALLCFPLLYLPGLLLSWALGAAARPADPLERHYERIAIGALFNGWLALTLAELALFSIWLHAALLLLACAALLFVAWRQRTLPRLRILHRSSFVVRRLSLDLWLFTALLAVAFTLTARPFQVLRGVMDAGTYTNSGLAIAQTGAIVQHDALMAQLASDAASPDPTIAEPAAQALSNFFSGQSDMRFIATKLRASGFFVLEGEAAQGRVVPQGLHLLPAWIALLASIGGPLLGLWAPGLLGVLSCWSVGMLGRRLAGRWVGALAFLLLALNGVQVWFSRYSTAETSMQFLLFAGLYFFAKMTATGNSQTPVSGDMALSPQHSVLSTQSSALIAGLAIGQIALTRLDFFLLGGPLVPVAAYLLYIAISRRWRRMHTIFALGLALMLAQASL
ncbi:MAG: hypothetical protein H7Y32_11975, partial [Chloroflexales bacterium]|nr:hypothetical protein [Chloroflexales bacterium]